MKRLIKILMKRFILRVWMKTCNRFDFKCDECFYSTECACPFKSIIQGLEMEE